MHFVFLCALCVKQNKMMFINRNNYENFFLLYADGELSASEHLAVEEFVAQNEDLRVELEMIQAAVLPLEEISLIDKSFLYKEIVFDTTLQQKLLLKIDNELPANEMANLDTLLQTNTNAKREFDLLTKTKLDATEKIIFEDKYLLYKKENDNVIPFAYWRWAAAAMLIGFALFTGVKIYKSKNNDNATIATTSGKKNEEATIQNKKTNTPVNTDVNAIGDSVSTINDNSADNYAENNFNNTKATIKNNKVTFETQDNVNNKNISKDFVTNTINQRITDSNKAIKELPVTQNRFIAKETILAPKMLDKINNIVVDTQIPVAINNTVAVGRVTEQLQELENTYSKNTTTIAEEKTDNKIFYMNEEKVKKSKVGGFFKKVKTLVERTANLKTGNSLQIAGFKIAAK